ncbi:Coatomer subunit beta-1 [Picochlorum sp. SENEW3]|nr:Coatomer subunit beta-1 [Picochlorum sp. SENEW3]WPT17389.1 Coatomer subunit beta-1 [Picochlorum sp. SENEW3]
MTQVQHHHEKLSTFLVSSESQGQASQNEIRRALESGDDEEKVEAMQQAIAALLNGEQMPQLFITIVRYVLPSENHFVQKLLLLYLETIQKTDDQGKLLPEMILICQNLRNNLQHPNEYIRGVTLRFLCRITEEELLEPLVPSVIQNLEHRHSYVRKNAVMALSAVYKLPKGELLVPDAPELIEKLLRSEQDLGTRRNAFKMLSLHDQDRAVAYLFDNIERIADWGDVLQVAVLELIRKVCRSNPQAKGRYIKIILALLHSRSASVLYECATTLVSLSNAPTAIRAAASCFCKLLVKQSDNNVKLIVLDRLAELKKKHKDIMSEMLMDMLRALSAPNLDVREKVLSIAMDLVNARSVDEVVTVLKKEAMKTQNKDIEHGTEYRAMLVRAIHQCAVRHPEVAPTVLHLLMDFLSDTNAVSALEVAYFLREIAETNPNLHRDIVDRMMDTFPEIRTSRVAACILWIIAEHCISTEEVNAALEMLNSCLGPLPLVGRETAENEEEDSLSSPTVSSPQQTTVKARPAVLADGSYATQTAIPGEEYATSFIDAGLDASAPNLRSMVLSGDFFLAAVLSSCMTKMLLRVRSNGDVSQTDLNKMTAEMMLTISNLLMVGELHETIEGLHPMDDDSRDRMAACMYVMANPDSVDAKTWVEGCRSSFETFLASKHEQEAEEKMEEKKDEIAQPDELIDFRHLKNKAMGPAEDEGMDDVAYAAGQSTKDSSKSGLAKVVQLTGFSDPIYAEAYVTSHQYDIVLDVSVTNRTSQTLQNVTLELATLGDLKLVERPQSYTIASGQSKFIRANIKVSSTETGAIFGNLVYESTGRSDQTVVVLSDIHIDIMDYIVPAYCPDVQFRSMWAEFEWENKVAINTTFTNPKAFLDHIIACTNMRCLSPESALEGDIAFLSANLYARSVFGEDALVNVSMEKLPNGKLGGFIRIRSKTQGIALSLGDKLIVKSKA